MTIRGVVNRNAYNDVNYRRYTNTCSGTTWKPESVGDWFITTTKSVKQTWTNFCRTTPATTSYFMDTARSYTKETGVDLVGVMKLSALSGYNRGTRMEFVVSKDSRFCGTSSGGLNESKGVRAFKP